MKILVTGAAGFIGFHACKALLLRGDMVLGVDNLNAYYDVALKEVRLEQLLDHPRFRIHKFDIINREALGQLFEAERPEAVLHLAAQAGVRYSLENPQAFIDANLIGFMNILEGCRQVQPHHLVFASSSSVYGNTTKIPFSVHDGANHPVSLYAATKKANEVLAHSYSHLFGIPSTGLRFFTVYGPWGRPDMAYFGFTRAILEGRSIDVYNHGRMQRDFTYIDDIVEGVLTVLDQPAQADPNWTGDSPDPASSSAPYRLFNIGHNQPVELLRFIEVLERCLGRTVPKNMMPMQPGDVLTTCADIEDLERAVGFRPRTTIDEGLDNFVTWYREFYRV